MRSIPVINGLTDLLPSLPDPERSLHDYRKEGDLSKDLKVAYIGDGNNIANSWIDAAARLPFHLTLACPEGYDPDREILERAARGGGRQGSSCSGIPTRPCEGADVVYTDVWASMGQEDEKESEARGSSRTIRLTGN